MPGAILLLLFLAVIGPIGLFLIGAIWSGLVGWFLSDEADSHAEAQPSS